MVKKKNQNYEVFSFVLGVLSIIGSFITPLLGIVFGIIGLKKSHKFILAKKMNILGIGLGIFILIISVFFVLNSQSNTTYLGEVIKQIFMIKI